MFNFKRLISTAVAFVMAASVMSTAFAAIPSDVAGTEYEEAAQVLGVLDIMVGDKDTGTFRPDDTIIRSEGARVAISALGLQEVAEVTNGATKYPDVVSNHWANGYINVATDQGMVIGDDVGTFRPDDTISYAEMVTIMIRALGYEKMAESRIRILSSTVIDKVKSLEEEDVLVVAGRGVRNEKDIEMCRELAEALGGQLAFTRPMVENGFGDTAHQIGLSGRTVRPKLIITCGVSGAIQFTSCMNGSDCIVAINNDPQAQIFGVADYCIVDDLYQVVPELTALAKKHQKEDN